MNVAIIAAAGQGVRMGSKRAKQFLELDGIPVIIHTLFRFEQCPDIQQIVVVLPEKDVKRFPALARKYGLTKVVNCLAGGETRAHSVKRGLLSLQRGPVKVVAVHDGVRPFVTPEEISLTVNQAMRFGAAILAAPVTDTLKAVNGSTVYKTWPRTAFRRALTPQSFRYEVLKQGFARAGQFLEKFTDESMLVEKFGKVQFVEGHARNIKITQPEDIAVAEIILKRNPEFRIEK
jgi:2-C-methyl-D-erythritol 4-phosphate cytidylyltransferase